MSTPIGHLLAGAGISYSTYPRSKKIFTKPFLIQTAWLLFVSILPDFDVFFGLLAGQTIFSMHRSFTHTIPFAAFISVITLVVVRYLLKKSREEALRWGALTLLVLLVHLLMDYIIMPLYLDESIHIYTGQERTVLGIFLPLLSSGGLTAIAREILITLPLFIISWVTRINRKVLQRPETSVD